MRSDLTFLFAFIAVVCTSVIPAIAAPVLGDSLQQFEARDANQMIGDMRTRGITRTDDSQLMKRIVLTEMRRSPPSPPPGPSTSLAGDTDSDAGQSESTQEPTQDPSTGEQPHKKGWGKRTKNRAKALWNKAKARIHRN